MNEPQVHQPQAHPEADHLDPSAAAPMTPAQNLPGTTPPSLLTRKIAGQPLRRWLLLAGAVAMAVWAVWATKVLVDLRRERQPIAQVRLSEIVGEYVRDAARSSLPAEEVSRQTGRFLKALNEVVAAQGAGGRIILLSNAVVSGEVPDITAQVRAQVYSRVSRLIAAPAPVSPPSSPVPSPVPAPAPASGDGTGQMRGFISSENAAAPAGGTRGEPR